MSRFCAITGKRTVAGRKICRHGIPKYKKGIGLKTRGITRRTFKPNTQTRNIWVPELGRFVRVKLSTKALKTITRDGAYQILSNAGLIPTLKPCQKKAE